MKIDTHFEDEPKNVQQEQVPFKHFKFNQFVEDIDKPVAAHLVKDVLQQCGMGLMIAPEKGGKSFVAIELGVYIAAGMEEWHGRRIAKACRGRPVIYISGEGAAGFRQRKKALAKHLGRSASQLAEMPFYDLQVAPNLSDSDTIINLINDIGLIGKPVLIVIDTLARTIYADQNDNEKMAFYVANCAKLQDHFGCSLLIVHHIPKASKSGPPGQVTPMGSVVLPASVDSCLKISNHENGEKLLEVFFAKDIVCGIIMKFKLKQVEVGVDDEGETVTSCVIQEVGDETTPGAYARKSGSSKDKGGVYGDDW